MLIILIIAIYIYHVLVYVNGRIKMYIVEKCKSFVGT